MPAKVINGARAIVYMSQTINGKLTSKPVAIWSNVNYQVGYDVQAVYILGRYTAAELNTVAVEPVSVTASGFRMVDHGIYNDGFVNKVQDLLSQEGVYIKILDRQTNKEVGIVTDCVATGFSGGVSIKSLADLQVSFMGIFFIDESGTVAETAGATNLP